MQTHKDKTMGLNQLIKEEDGSIIVIVLVLLMLVTVMGISSTTTSTVEIQIAGNERTYKTNFYTAEAEAMEAVQRMEEADTDTLKLNEAGTQTWIQALEVDLDNPTDVANNTQSVTEVQSSGISTTTGYYAINQGFTSGTSLGMTGTSQLYTFEVHGFVRGDRGRSHIEVGYKRRF
jgi:Tfp pilus assembly protein PilX